MKDDTFEKSVEPTARNFLDSFGGFSNNIKGFVRVAKRKHKGKRSKFSNLFRGDF